MSPEAPNLPVSPHCALTHPGVCRIDLDGVLGNMATGCDRYLTADWAGRVHALMIELCGRCTCEDEQEVQALWAQSATRERVDA